MIWFTRCIFKFGKVFSDEVLQTHRCRLQKLIFRTENALIFPVDCIGHFLRCVCVSSERSNEKRKCDSWIMQIEIVYRLTESIEMIDKNRNERVQELDDSVASIENDSFDRQSNTEFRASFVSFRFAFISFLFITSK